MNNCRIYKPPKQRWSPGKRKEIAGALLSGVCLGCGAFVICAAIWKGSEAFYEYLARVLQWSM